MPKKELEFKVLDFDLRTELVRQFKGLKGCYNVLLKVKKENQLNTAVNLISLFAFEGNKQGIIALLKKDSKYFMNLLESSIGNSRMQNLYFVDCVSEIAEPALHLQSSSIEDLNQLTLSIELLLRETPEIDFLLVDLLNPVLLYNDEKTFSKFIRFFMQKLSKHDVRGLFLVIETEKNRHLIDDIAVFFDRTIELKI